MRDVIIPAENESKLYHKKEVIHKQDYRKFGLILNSINHLK